MTDADDPEPRRARDVTVQRSLHRPAGSLAAGPWSLAVAPEDAGWAYSGLRVADLAAGGAVSFGTGPDEVIILPLNGSFEVTCVGSAIELAGRRGVFDGPTDFAYAPPGVDLVIASASGGRVAVPSARAEARFPFATLPRRTSRSSSGARVPPRARCARSRRPGRSTRIG